MIYKIIHLPHYQHGGRVKVEYLTPVLKKIKENNNAKQYVHLKTIILFTDISEQRVFLKDSIEGFNTISKLCDDFEIDYYFLLDGIKKDYHEFKSDKVIHCNYMLLLNYWLFVIGHHKKAKKWNSETDIGLFLTGKVWRTNRGPLLYNFWKNDLLNNILWSFYDTDDNYKKVKDKIDQIFENITEEQFNLFLKDCVRVLDLENRMSQINNSGYFSHNGHPFDVNLYENTLYSIVSETHFEGNTIQGEKNYSMYSEKTLRAIMNHHPFIIAGHTGLLKHLEELGFKTFKNYLSVPDYNDTYDTKSKLDFIVENVKTFSSNCKKFKEEIEKDVIHNVNLLEKLSIIEANTLMAKLGKDSSIIEQIILAHSIDRY